jgi:hypothetical protein
MATENLNFTFTKEKLLNFLEVKLAIRMWSFFLVKMPNYPLSLSSAEVNGIILTKQI